MAWVKSPLYDVARIQKTLESGRRSLEEIGATRTIINV
jgi:hypothetical protein